MNYLINYNKNFDVLTITLDNTKTVTKVEKQSNLAIIYNNKDIIGFNIFDLKLATSGNQTYNKNIIKLVNDKIKDFLVLNYEPKFIVAKIVSIEDIVGTHLHKCSVLVGPEKELKIICGASNARKDLVTVCALNNAVMPNGDIIKIGKVKGFDSYGMLCSGRELQIQDFNNEGILELDEKKYKIGQDFFEVYFNEKN